MPVEGLVVKLLTPGGRRADLTLINSGNREAVINLLREIATGKRETIGTEVPSQTGAQIALLRLGDPPTIESAIAAYRASHGEAGGANRAEDLVWSEQAAIIPYLAEDYFREDGDRSTIRSKGDVIGVRVTPLSAYSGFVSLKIMASSSQFSPEARGWALARRNQGIYPFVAFRNEMRVWWRQNEAAFKAGNYLAVKPPVPEPPPSLPNPEDSRRVIQSLPVVNSLPTPGTSIPSPIPPLTLANAEKPVPKSTHWWAWVLGIAALFVIVTLALKRRV